jgi:hypothetical protein
LSLVKVLTNKMIEITAFATFFVTPRVSHKKCVHNLF